MQAAAEPAVTEAPANPGPGISLAAPDEERCTRYSRAKLAVMLAESGLMLALLAGIALSGASRSMLDAAVWAVPHAPPWPSVAHLIYLLMLGTTVRLALLPAHWFDEVWLEQKFGLSQQTWSTWAWEWVCRSTVFGVATALLLWPVVEFLRWWPWLALPWCLAFLACRNLFFDRVYYPLLDRFYPVRFLRDESFVLPGIGRRTLPVYEVRVSHRTRRVNAAIRLRGSQAAIFVTDTLIDAFTDGEERVVMAHEFGHLYDRLHLEEHTAPGVAQARRKLLLGSVQILAGAAGLGAMALVAPRVGLGGPQNLAGFPLLVAITLLFAQALSPLLRAESRRDEHDADSYALQITGDPETYLAVMRKLRLMNLEEADSSPLVRFLFDTHPSYSERAHLATGLRRKPARRRRTSWHGRRNVQRHGRR